MSDDTTCSPGVNERRPKWQRTIKVGPHRQIAHEYGAVDGGGPHDIACAYCLEPGTVTIYRPGTYQHRWADKPVPGWVVHATLGLDHIQPFSRGGLNEPANLQYACHSCNASKGAKTLPEWYDWLAAMTSKRRPKPRHVRVFRQLTWSRGLSWHG